MHGICIFRLFLVIFDEFAPMVRRIFHQNVLDLHLFGHIHLFGEIQCSCLHLISDMCGKVLSTVILVDEKLT